MEARARKATRQLPCHDEAINRKPDVGTQTVGATGSKLSFQTLAPRTAASCTPTKPTRNCTSSSKGKGSIKWTVTMLCIQYKADAFTEADSPMNDGIILQEPLV